jgi:hypothetical protein
MHYFKKLNDNYFIYAILIFVFLPLNYLPQLQDGVLFSYMYETGNFSALKLWYTEISKQIHLLVFYIIDFLVRHTFLPAEIFFDGTAIIFLILLCFEVKKYSKFLFGLENKWSNLAALFTAIFPVWHTLVAINISLYVFSIYFLFFGYRNFISNNGIKIFIGLLSLIISFNLESNLCFVIGLAFVHLILSKANNKYDFSLSKFIRIILISFAYYFLKDIYFPPFGRLEGYNVITIESLVRNLTDVRFINNIINYSTYLLLYLWLPIIFLLHISFINKKYISRNNLNLQKKLNIKRVNNYSLLLILSVFAVFPYLVVNSWVPSILYLADYYQRHAFLLAPIFGIFFSTLFRDMTKINCFENKVNLNFYITIFICFNLLLLNYGSYRKIESHLFKKNLIAELKTFGSIPIGNVELIGRNIPADLRTFELSYLFYKAYNIAGWWVIHKPFASFNPPSYILKPPSYILNDIRYSNLFIIKDYKYGCTTRIYLENSLKKYQRIKQFYVFKYKKYYNIDKIEKKC